MVIRSLFSSALLFLLAFGAWAQDTTLELNGPLVHGSLRAPQAHHFTIALAAEGWALLRIDQQGVDLAISTFATNGAKIQEFDSPNGATGPEWVRLSATSAGRYGVEVRAIDEQAPEGSYSIRVVAVGAKPADASAELDAFLARYATQDSPGLAIRVMHHGEVVYSKGSGLADLAHGLPITTTTAFHVGSITKQFTAFALLLLERDGLLSLEDDVHRFLPELPTDAKPITLRELVQHRSGFRDIDDLLRLRGIGPNDEVTQAEAVDLLLRQTGLNFEPGTAMEYSNSGYILLAEVVGRVSGKPFPVFVQERILEPLGMGSSQVLAAPGRIVPNSARSYGLDGADYMERPLNSTFYGSTGLCTSVEDLCKWAANFTSHVVGDHALVERMQRSGVLTTGEPLTYAMGLDHKEYRGIPVVFHGGGIAAYRAYLVRVPAHDLLIAIASNAEDLNPITTAEKTMDLFLADEIAVAERSKAPARSRASRPAALLGDYELFPGMVFSVEQAKKRLMLRIPGNDAPVPLKEVGENRFQLGDRFNELLFRIGAHGKATGFDYHLYDFTWQAKKVDLLPVDMSAVPSADYNGKYWSEELGVTLVVRSQDNALVVDHHRWGVAPLVPFQADVFTTGQAHLSKLTFVRDEQGVVSDCLVSGQRSRNVMFKRLE
ncbi:MAG TPA: serine hydrolase domain-containing protein [Flavobacteriales bacterium]|nr:serine hydrolase domain-containing protein [Flavobacteriales bacterium]